MPDTFDQPLIQARARPCRREASLAYFATAIRARSGLLKSGGDLDRCKADRSRGRTRDQSILPEFSRWFCLQIDLANR
jgi:tRNA U34 5-methylaminomethyl-2-thiouridine-forming methyltransferase MnmC